MNEPNLYGKDLFGDVVLPPRRGALADKFLIPPFSVLNAREGFWQERKSAWNSIGIKGAEGRGGELHSGDTVDARNGDEWEGGRSCWQNEGTSVFDPVLCELAYKWFCPNSGTILDPFAGEATKGIVATFLGYKYVGIELRAEQIEANRKQAEKIEVTPEWFLGDSAKLSELVPKEFKADMVFTSPPYYDLEIYSKDEKDGSAFETYEKFMVWYENIFRQAVEHLRENRFLVVKVGEIRDEKGYYRNFVGDNISCFLRLGLKYYNEAILITSVGSLPIRVGRQFLAGRKLGKTHQNILVFFKGDAKNIKAEFGNGSFD